MDLAVDTTGQVQEVLGMPEHLRDALWRVESAGIAPSEAPGGLIVAGMGGSAIGARLAAGAIGDRARRPLSGADGYALPPWAGPDHFLLCASYSGNTEETLACYDQARARGVPRAVATTGGALAERAREDGVPVVPLPGGFQPRHAVGYAVVVALEMARLCGAAPDLRGEIEAAAAALSDAPAGAQELARELDGRVPVVYGAELTAPLAYRWKSQFNENAKVPAFAAELPEADHNEICGWWPEPLDARFAAILLAAPSLSPRNRARLAATGRVAADGGLPVHEVELPEGPPLVTLMSGVLLGDLVSLYAAVLRGVDPVEIHAIDRLKSELA